MLWELHASQTWLSHKIAKEYTYESNNPIFQVLKTIMALSEHSKLHFKYTRVGRILAEEQL